MELVKLTYGVSGGYLVSAASSPSFTSLSLFKVSTGWLQFHRVMVSTWTSRAY